jgi:hypothetical protein
MNQPITKIGIDIFLNEIKFSKEYYFLYKTIFNNRMEFTEEIFVYFILQIAHKKKFQGHFDELYVDVVKRKPEYIKELIHNFRKSYIGEPSIYNKFYKLFFCVKLTNKEIYFNRNIIIIGFDNIFNTFFELNNEDKKNKFITLCENIYNIKVTRELEYKINLKLEQNKKHTSFTSSTKIFTS